MLTRKVAVFVDGENLVFRYQEMLKSGRQPHPDVTHFPDHFVWSKRILFYGRFYVSRLTYYTSATGDEQQINTITDRIRGVHFYSKDGENGLAEPIVAKVFKKSSKSQKSRHVDINITLDALVAAFTHSIDTIILITGDGDFVPVVRELMHRGLKVHCLGLSSGLNPELQRTPDYSQVFDELFFSDRPARASGSVKVRLPKWATNSSQ